MYDENKEKIRMEKNLEEGGEELGAKGETEGGGEGSSIQDEGLRVLGALRSAVGRGGAEFGEWRIFCTRESATSRPGSSL